ncbi:MAG TPA: response regulator [Candidatus Ozemobacteraceae bacterium]|nr:response regulator [Candidatus Ozemobacteraceae bacterium]
MDTETDNKKTILIVDDIPDNIEVLRGTLFPQYRIKAATSGAKALAIASGDEPPDLILLDIMMPGMDGYEVCSILKGQEKTKSIPVIFVTAKDDPIDEEKGLKIGAVDYITKPINPRIIEARIATHLALRQAMIDLERQNELLIENVRLREQVDRIMRHDLKTPLTVFLSIPSLLKQRTDLPPDVIETIGMMEKSGYRMLDMINRSMDLFRMESGTYECHPVPVDVAKIVRQITFELGETANGKSVLFRLESDGREVGDDEEILISGEASLFYSMLANLIKNAFEASPAGGTVTVSLVVKPIPCIRIHNAGTIPSEIRGTFLQKYVTHGKKGGTGLGCYSARLMAETMGGTVTFASSEQDGTAITVAFPGSAAGHEESMPVSTGDLRVLAVNANLLVLYSIRDLLRSLGLHQIQLEKSAEEARNFLSKSQPVQLVILDWSVPGNEAGRFLSWLRAEKNHRTVPLIIITSEPAALRGKTAGLEESDELLGKPFSAVQLQTQVERVFGRMRQLVRRK